MYVATGVANRVAYPLAAAVSRHGVRGIGSLAVAYGGALAVRCIAPYLGSICSISSHSLISSYLYRVIMLPSHHLYPQTFEKAFI